MEAERLSDVDFLFVLEVNTVIKECRNRTFFFFTVQLTEPFVVFPQRMCGRASVHACVCVQQNDCSVLRILTS